MSSTKSGSYISNIFTTTSNTKYIIMVAFVLLLVILGYVFFSSKGTENGKGSGGSKSCSYGIDEKGNCIQPEVCGGEIKPPTSCPDDQSLICDPVLQKWRCKLSCESESNPFPNDFSNCETKNIKCSDGKYYCDSDYCKNGGILYSTSYGKCTCPKYFSGDKCECDSSKCKDGLIDSKCDKCLTCCDKNTSVDNRCQYYGDNCDNKCDTNEVYYQDEQKCKCPLNSCFKIDDKGNCVHLETSQCCIHGSVQNGICICDPNSGWSGPNCDIPICGEYGQWDKTQNKCICNKDSNGKPLAAGDKCEYTREKLCSGNGIPQYSNSNGIASCICDAGYSGDHCTCKDQNKPTQDLDEFKCKGIYSKCKETPNSDGTYSGEWVDGYKDCNSIYNDYLSQNLWESKCTDVLYPNNPYPDYYVKCVPKEIPDNEGVNTFIPVGPTCFVKNPGDVKLQNCREENNRTGKCYISWDDKGQNQKSSTIFNKYCICEEKNGVTSYSCQPVTDEKECGPEPPLGFCIGPDGKTPVNPGCAVCGSNHIWACDQSILPPECIAANNNLNYFSIPNSDKSWFSDRGNINPIFPTVNMDKCDSAPFDTLTSDNKFQGYKSINSAPGFVSGIGTSNQIFYNWDDDKLVNYNVNADIFPQSDDITKGKIQTNKTKPYPFPDSDQTYMFDDNYLAYVGCAKFKKPFDPIYGNDNTRCDVSEDGTEKGTFIQYCADINGNIVPCGSKDNNVHYKTDKGYCSCNTYYSKAQNNDVKHKGRYCQYNDNETCSGKGVVDDNGNCECSKSVVKYCSQAQKTFVDYTGKKCNYDDNNYCNGLGIVYYNTNVNGPSCDFSVLLDTKKYTKIIDASLLNDGDIIILEYAKGGMPIITNPDGKTSHLTITPTGLFIGRDGSFLASVQIPDAFIVKKFPGTNFYTFNLVDTKTNSPYGLSSNNYLYTDNNAVTIYSNNPNPYILEKYPYYEGLYNISNTSSPYPSWTPSILCNPSNYNKLQTPSSPFDQTYWIFYKFNIPLNIQTCT